RTPGDSPSQRKRQSCFLPDVRIYLSTQGNRRLPNDGFGFNRASLVGQNPRICPKTVARGDVVIGILFVKPVLRRGFRRK
ncbi:MAG: hypothetical protein FWH25_01870, partial [Syntrophorhabdaceae bacterium]|nr:hypothetical protein [Syntrophorhabdaceae bacterium]